MGACPGADRGEQTVTIMFEGDGIIEKRRNQVH
jgi:hypothetical protein